KVDFNYVRHICREPNKLLIDVRSQREIKETGQIPCSINIALDALQTNLDPAISEADFRSRFGRVKPTKSTEIIFSCHSGRRALQSAEQAVAMGYTNVWVYDGSWKDWKRRISK
ncbi:hypothetical protein KR222_009415, partial [Zaprionus bogoriensis]